MGPWTMLLAAVVVAWAVLRLVGAERQIKVRQMEIRHALEQVEAMRAAEKTPRKK